MITDAIDAPDALSTALQEELDALLLLHALLVKLQPGPLRFQYLEVLDETARQERRVRAQLESWLRSGASVTAANVSTQVGRTIPPEHELDELNSYELLTLLADNAGRGMDMLEDLAERCLDAETSNLLHLVAQAEFQHKSKFLMDLELHRRYKGYL